MSIPIIEARNISRSYGSNKALDSLSFEVNKGELFGFIGPDGAGKTTLFRILTTLLLADEGTARLGNFDVVKDYREIRKSIGYMPGKFSLYKDLSVEENLQFFATIFGTSIEENYDLIKHIYVHIEPFRKRLAGRLSGGMKQKLALCCALIHKPEILILDEPTTGVDAVSRKEFWEMLRNLKAGGLTILVSTPYMDEATLCDRIALIQKGKILSIDEPKAIMNNFPKPLFSIQGASIYKLIEDMEAYVNTESVEPFGQLIHFIPKDGSVEPEKLIQFLKLKGHDDARIIPITAGIEDVFMLLMSSAKPIENA
jgi:ABC-2 type transport system ATP-binding protein